MISLPRRKLWVCVPSSPDVLFSAAINWSSGSNWSTPHENRQLWSQVFNRNAAEAQLIQEEISLGIAERLRALEPSIGPSQMTTRDLVKPRAFEHLLRARFALRQYTPESTRKAIELYQLAIKEEPGYADAHAELAYAYRVLGANAFGDPAETNPKARQSAERALQINDKLALAHLVIGEIERDNWNWSAAESTVSRGERTEPEYAGRTRSIRDLLERSRTT